MKKNKQICIIDKKIGEYYTRNYVLNKRYFNVKSIMLMFFIFSNQDYYINQPLSTLNKIKIEWIKWNKQRTILWKKEK